MESGPESPWLVFLFAAWRLAAVACFLFRSPAWPGPCDVFYFAAQPGQGHVMFFISQPNKKHHMVK